MTSLRAVMTLGCVWSSAVSAAIKDVFNETRCCLEPAGAVAVAGAKAYLQRHGMQASLAERCSRLALPGMHRPLQCLLAVREAHP